MRKGSGFEQFTIDSAGNVGATAMIPTSEATEQKGDREAQESRVQFRNSLIRIPPMM
jgi:hypothetical protein